MKNKLWCLSLALIGVLAMTCSSWASSPPGFGEGMFAQRGRDARALSMGGAFVAIAQGPSTPSHNPAGLGYIDQLNLSGLYSEPYGEGFGVTYQSFSLMGPLGVQTESRLPIGVGLQWMTLRVDGIQLWDDWGQAGVTDAGSSVYMLSGGGRLATEIGQLSVGASIKYYTARLLEGRGSGVGFDVGLLLGTTIAGMPLRIGVNYMDIGTTAVHWTSLSGPTENIIPSILKMGLAISPWEWAVFAAATDWRMDRPLSEQILRFGLELSPVEFVHLRAGWSKSASSVGQASLGAGISLVERITLDYAYLPASLFGASHLISAMIAF